MSTSTAVPSATQQLIIEQLERAHGNKLDAHLTAEARARGHVIRRMLEEAFYWMVVFVRWSEPEGWAAYRPIFLPLMPPVVGGVIVELLRKG